MFCDVYPDFMLTAWLHCIWWGREGKSLSNNDNVWKTGLLYVVMITIHSIQLHWLGAIWSSLVLLPLASLLFWWHQYSEEECAPSGSELEESSICEASLLFIIIITIKANNFFAKYN